MRAYKEAIVKVIRFKCENCWRECAAKETEHFYKCECGCEAPTPWNYDKCEDCGAIIIKSHAKEHVCND